MSRPAPIVFDATRPETAVTGNTKSSKNDGLGIIVVVDDEEEEEKSFSKYAKLEALILDDFLDLFMGTSSFFCMYSGLERLIVVVVVVLVEGEGGGRVLVPPCFNENASQPRGLLPIRSKANAKNSF